MSFNFVQILVLHTMDLRRSLKLVVEIILIGYFVNKIIVAKTKLEDRKIGTSLRKKNFDTVHYPAITACLYGDFDTVSDSWRIGQEFSDGPKNIISRYIYYRVNVNGSVQLMEI